MKYIKTYEYFEGEKLKKYSIWHIEEDNYYEIIEIINEYPTFKDYDYETKTIYVYYSDIDTLETPDFKNKQYTFKEGGGDSFHLEDSRDYLHYTSNSLQDCIDMLPIISKVKKYNL